MSAITARDVFFLYRASYGEVAALRGFSLEVSEGEVVAVLGPSGAGKSTLLRLCAGYERPSSGELTVLGVPLGAASRRTRDRLRRDSIGTVRQHYHRVLPPELAAEEIVALPLRLRGRWGTAERARVAALLERAGLAQRVGARPFELSGGEQQRVAVCAALAPRPRLLLVDEPTGELDAANSKVVVDLLLELAAESGTTTLIVTHDTGITARVPRTIHLRDGRLSAEGVARPALVVDEQGWLRLPRGLREQAGLRERVRASASWGRIELLAEDAPGVAPPQRHVSVASAETKRYGMEAVLDRVTKRYGQTTILDAVTWSFAAERLHVLAGASGSGKTTYLNLLAGLDRSDEGAIWVGGERIDGLSPDELARWRRRSAGYVSQHSTLVDFLSAQENVELGLALRGFPHKEAGERAERWLSWVGLGALAERRADRLSGGEQRRVALARALAPSPRILFADEPTAHLDQLSGRLVMRLLRQAITEAGTTVIAASHDQAMIAAADEVFTLGDSASHTPPGSGVATVRQLVDENTSTGNSAR